MSPKQIDSLSPLVYHLLVTLVDGPLHGYAILLDVEKDAGPETVLGPSSVYGTLERLARQGLIRELPGKGRAKRRYALTPEGHEALWRESARLARVVRLADSKGLLRERGGAG